MSFELDSSSLENEGGKNSEKNADDDAEGEEGMNRQIRVSKDSPSPTKSKAARSVQWSDESLPRAAAEDDPQGAESGIAAAERERRDGGAESEEVRTNEGSLPSGKCAFPYMYVFREKGKREGKAEIEV